MPGTTEIKTYTPLLGLNIPVGKCSALLPNHMQCWRGADVQVSVHKTSTDEPDIVDTYQLCSAHAKLEQAKNKLQEMAQADLTKAEVEVKQTESEQSEQPEQPEPTE